MNELKKLAQRQDRPGMRMLAEFKKNQVRGMEGRIQRDIIISRNLVFSMSIE